ncbi:MAG: Omp28-related outer membrane protein [Saprospiraceae bacterium]
MKVLAHLFMIWSLMMIWSCEEIPIELSDPVIPDSERVVLLEDLTGVSCPNCTKASSVIKNILAKFPDRVAVIGIHGDLLTTPIPGKSKYDFRNQKAKDLEKFFNPFGKPSASINRVPTDDNELTIPLPDLWQAAVEKELQKEHQMNILFDIVYDETSRKVSIDIATIPLNDLNGIFNISVFMTESNIIDAQSDGPVINENYNHQHVLREMMTKFDGDNLGSDLKREIIMRRNYDYTLPTLWKVDNMEVVVVVHHNSSNDKSVVQAVVKKIKR